jgi:hypothetical protein
MTSPTTYQFLVSINLKTAQVPGASGLLGNELPSQTSMLLEAPLNITLHDLTMAITAKLHLNFFAMHPGYWTQFSTSDNDFKISVPLLHRACLSLRSDTDVAQALAFIKQRNFVDPLVVDYNAAEQPMPVANRISSVIAVSFSVLSICYCCFDMLIRETLKSQPPSDR